jgi:hypothetical protein
MKKLFATYLLAAAGYATSAQIVEMKRIEKQAEVLAPEVTALFAENFPELGPVKWYNMAAGHTGEFFLMSDPITDEQKDINQTIRVIGCDVKGDGVIQVSDILNIGVNAENQRDRTMSHDTFLETTDNGWEITETIMAEDAPVRDAYGRVTEADEIEPLEIKRFIESAKGFDKAVDAVKGMLPPPPRFALIRGRKTL